ncbi:MAG: hypothetical protein F6K65_26725 [Moorea sp. SIO3C2]|nr:hypothetical protein [Moorena sp. SIO3C2]
MIKPIYSVYRTYDIQLSLFPLFPIPYSLLPNETMNQQRQKPHYSMCRGFRIPMGFPVTCFESGLNYKNPRKPKAPSQSERG